MILSKKRITKGADQSARMRRLVCAFVVFKPLKTDFLASGPIYICTSPWTFTYTIHTKTSGVLLYDSLGTKISCI